MIHPMHLHGMHMTVIAKDGWDQPEPWKCDTLNIAPGERWDVLVKATNPGGVGVPLPHPAARRVGARDVRHGDCVDRKAGDGLSQDGPSSRPLIRVHIVQKNSPSPAAWAAPPSTTSHLIVGASLAGRANSPASREAVPSVMHQ